MSSHHEMIENITSTLEEWDYKFDRLEHRIRDLPGEVSDQVRYKLDQLQQQKSKLIERSRALEQEAGEAIDLAEESIEDIGETIRLLFEEVELDVNVEFS